jgi:autotransporter-associated beta strand protein
LTAAPGATLNIGSPTSTATNNVTFALSHADNVNTFQGNINARRGVLRLDSSLNAANFSGTGMGGANVASVQVQAGQTFTFGSGGTNTTYDGIVAGAGTFRKVGNGTTTFNGTNANTHSGDTKIEDGTLSITQAYLANAGDVYLSTGSIFDLNFAATDTIGALFIDGVQQALGTWGGTGSGATNITALITGTGILDVTEAPGAGDADYNADGVIDAADYVAWRKDPAANGGDPAGYVLWTQQFGQASPGAGGGGAVPEPTTIGLVLIGLATLAGRRRG